MAVRLDAQKLVVSFLRFDYVFDRIDDYFDTFKVHDSKVSCLSVLELYLL